MNMLYYADLIESKLSKLNCPESLELRGEWVLATYTMTSDARYIRKLKYINAQLDKLIDAQNMD